MPHPAMKQRINEATTELELVASREVIEAGNRYLAEIGSPGLAAAMNRPGLTTFDQGVDRFQDYMETARKEVVSAMRKDLGVTKRPARAPTMLPRRAEAGSTGLHDGA